MDYLPKTKGRDTGQKDQVDVKTPVEADQGFMGDPVLVQNIIIESR